MRVLSPSLVFVATVALASGATAPRAPQMTDVALEKAFGAQVRPFLENNCLKCHGPDKQEGDVDFSTYSNPKDVLAAFDAWDLAMEMVDSGEMPPVKAKVHPTELQRQEFTSWIRSLRRNEAWKNAGDPGRVPAHRLSNSEYNYTILDLTGADIKPTKTFPVDAANQAGFDNTAESLSMSPALVKKYLDAAREVSEHLVLQPDGFVFASHPVVAETDRDKYSVLKIVDFYQRQPTDYAQYFHAAWRYQHRSRLGQRRSTLADVAAAEKVSPKYLSVIWELLNAKNERVGPTAKIQELFRALPVPPRAASFSEVEVLQRCGEMRDYVVNLRRKIVPLVANLKSPPGGAYPGSSLIQEGSQTLVLYKDRAQAANRRLYDTALLRTPEEAVVEIERSATAKAAEVERKAAQNAARKAAAAARQQNVETDPKLAAEIAKANAITEQIVQKGGKFLAAAITTTNLPSAQGMVAQRGPINDPDLIVPADPAQRAAIAAAFARFADVFPDAFYITERARTYLDPKDEKDNGGRLLSAGFHSMTGYFRDDGPLYDLVLDEKGKQELDRLWNEFNFYAKIPTRMYSSFLWFERTDSSYMQGREFDPFRPEDKSASEQERIQKLREVYLDKAQKNNASPEVERAINEHFSIAAANNLWLAKTQEAAVPYHLKALENFAERAYRRPLSEREREGIQAFYRLSRADNGLDHEDAMRDSIARVLMSPNFCYRTDPGDVAAAAVAALPKGSAVTFASMKEPASRVAPASIAAAGYRGAIPLSNYGLANRLSYFLWSSMPDEELLALARTGEIQRPDVLVAQARRMLKDRRAQNFATEFAGHWLDFRRFEEHNAVDRERYPSFDDNLREAMYQEPLKFFVNLLKDERPIQDFLYADYTYVNAPLAKHYGINGNFSPDAWVRAEHVDRIDRGGLMPMAVFLTANSPGLRTSPVKRGYWVVRRLLGESIPPPPATVPALPADEKHLGELTLREALVKHRADPQCASCHARFDSFGLAFEGYGAVGERRTLDFAGHPVEINAEFPGGSTGSGLAGLRDYVRAHRENDFIHNLSSKLLAYGLGRTLLLSDDFLLDDMKDKLASDGFRFRAMVEAIVTSPQFRTKRAPADHVMRTTLNN